MHHAQACRHPVYYSWNFSHWEGVAGAVGVRVILMQLKLALAAHLISKPKPKTKQTIKQTKLLKVKIFITNYSVKAGMEQVDTIISFKNSIYHKERLQRIEQNSL